MFRSLLFGLLALLLCAPQARAEDSSAPPEKVFRLAYVQAYPYWSYTYTFEYLQEYLKRAGWGERISFPPELHFNWSEQEIDEEDYRRQARTILARDDYDLLLSFGTTATRILLEENQAGRPMVGLSISDPLGAGLIRSPEDSGADYFTTVTYGAGHGSYMFILFHELMKFKSLGIMYHDDDDGRAYTYLKEAREVARDRGFKLVEYNRVGPEESLGDCEAAVRYLVDQEVEALFIPNISCFDTTKNDLKPLFEYIYKHNKLTFISEDRDLVRKYALMGMLFSDVRYLAHFQGEQIINILSGQKPGRQVMTAPFRSKIMLNMAAAERLGFKFDLGLLTLSDEIYLSLPGLAP